MNRKEVPIIDHQINSTVIMVSLDGFKPEYLSMCTDNCINLRSIYQKGVKAKSMRPIFPSKTFPNHYTLVTGLYAESHGIVSNRFYDPNYDAVFKLGSQEAFNPRWWLGEPIWVTAEKQGLVSASYFWPGSDVAIQGMYPSYYKKYDESIPYADRIKTIFEWFDSDKRPRLILTYFEVVDTVGHALGPEYTTELAEAIRKVDQAVGLIIQGLNERNATDKVDLIIVSDHGMAKTPDSQVVSVSDILGKDIIGADVLNMNDGPFFDFYFKDKSQVDEIYGQLAANIMNSIAFSSAIQGVYTRKNMPPRFHYSQSDRIADILILAKVEYSIKRTPSSTKYGQGNHGFDNESAQMSSLFMAQGKHFKSGLLYDGVVRNLDIYSTICQILNIVPAPNNGTAQGFQSLLN
ncbi:predicted protein [Naegleria gruberi]|uniref:Predicted protein n=1 Tax=Naegleria gruberi TaxID=5762 RepID=D2V7Q3_NAEGR|nr:uncharacterized protein NAEGRDRAFT_31890 [Naegleria gruberi]EFC47040.1 predicted protein [Naegleria gruberi]|eukprot:XP_002679784.1 predicted protein [Naegleria gruberi strain NEG-M]